ncbi:DUF6773 family protein [Desulfitobacterium chlororespirans]|uniref:Uncharacterized protein n=1 Tax=Desulfitobacterium chlororespirans DSM 11544 TaxID=1121395 RepID=A0A1M7UJP3_9FIRM|nr:DUF6773 family protein [Desulfitobacterium chlororespirans]SHN83243.1 hypothetical protein SAMN02745215_03986 [Desulfitobacterium chlororespirans DSM 11544]
MKDERIEQAQNKIRSELAVITYLAIALSFLVKTLAFEMSLTECITEYLILIFFPLYQFVRMHTMKISLYSSPGSKQYRNNLLFVASTLLITAALFVFGMLNRSTIVDFHKPVLFLVLFMVLFVVVYFIANGYNRHKAHKYETEFDDED